MKTIIESIIGRRGIRYFTAKDLQDGDIIILRSGVAMLIRNGEARVILIIKKFKILSTIALLYGNLKVAVNKNIYIMRRKRAYFKRSGYN